MKFKKLGQYLRERRIEAGLTQNQLSDHLGYSNAQFVSNWERGVSSPPGKSLGRIVSLLKINENEILNLIMEEQRAYWKAQISNRRRRRSS